MVWEELFDKDTLAIFIPIVAIVVGGVIAITWMIFAHRERMAMIERGIHPDHPPDEDDPNEDPDTQYPETQYVDGPR